MPRGRSAAQIAADIAPHRGGAVLLELLFTSGPLLSVEESTEAADGVEGLAFTLTGLPAGVFDLVVSEPYQGRIAKLYEQRFDADHVAVETPSLEYIGRMTALTSDENVASRTWTVTIQTEQFDADSQRPTNIRFSDAEQRRRYPGDLGAEYAASLVERVLRRTLAG